MQTVRVCKTDELADGEKIVVDTGSVEIGVFRQGGEYFAWKNQCPHQGGPVCQGRFFTKVIEKLDDEKRSLGRDYEEGVAHIVCPWHGLEFDVRTGRFAGASEQDIMSLEGYPVQVQGDDVYVVV